MINLSHCSTDGLFDAFQLGPAGWYFGSVVTDTCMCTNVKFLAKWLPCLAARAPIEV